MEFTRHYVLRTDVGIKRQICQKYGGSAGGFLDIYPRIHILRYPVSDFEVHSYILLLEE